MSKENLSNLSDLSERRTGNRLTRAVGAAVGALALAAVTGLSVGAVKDISNQPRGGVPAAEAAIKAAKEGDLAGARDLALSVTSGLDYGRDLNGDGILENARTEATRTVSLVASQAVIDAVNTGDFKTAAQTLEENESIMRLIRTNPIDLNGDGEKELPYSEARTQWARGLYGKAIEEANLGHTKKAENYISSAGAYGETTVTSNMKTDLNNDGEATNMRREAKASVNTESD